MNTKIKSLLIKALNDDSGKKLLRAAFGAFQNLGKRLQILSKQVVHSYFRLILFRQIGSVPDDYKNYLEIQLRRTLQKANPDQKTRLHSKILKATEYC